MIILIIVLCVVGCAGIGKILTRSKDRNNQLFGQGSPQGRMWRTSLAVPDPVENPRGLDDGTDFGYKEFD